MTKRCVISAVGKESCHRSWMDKTGGFDVHLIVYDDTYDKYKQDTPFVLRSKGQKYKLIYNYLNHNTRYLNQYDYFYMPDDDILIDNENILRLFDYMVELKLAMAQPALTNSYYSHPITIKQPNKRLRYTNFVEMMQPCFSKEALKKVLFTFNENASGWGIDFHWGKLVDYQNYNTAIIDDVASVHTRQVQSINENNKKELYNYLRKYNLTTTIFELQSTQGKSTQQ